MNADRIKEIQMTTAYPESVSVQQALFQVWNECEQEAVKNCSIPAVIKSVCDKQKCELYLDSGIAVCEHCVKHF